MKIITVIPFDYLSSIQDRSLKIANELYKEKNITTVFIAPGDGFSFSHLALSNTFKIYKTSCTRPLLGINLHSLTHNINWMIYIPKCALEFYRILELEKPNLIQINGLICLQEALVAALFFRKKIIWNLIGTLYPKPLIILLLPLIRSVRKRLFVAKSIVNYYFGLNSDIVIYEPVDMTIFDVNNVDVSKVQALRKRLCLENSYVIGFVGAITPIKNIECLIESIYHIAKKCPKIKLIIVGGIPPHQNSYYRKLKHLTNSLGLTDKVLFFGSANHKDIPLFLSIFDVFVLCSNREGTPVCILEAMAMKKPVVATSVGGIPEIVRNNKTGILVPPENPELLAEAVISLLLNLQKRRELGESGWRWVQESFSIERCVRNYESLYRELVRYQGKK